MPKCQQQNNKTKIALKHKKTNKNEQTSKQQS